MLESCEERGLVRVETGVMKGGMSKGFLTCYTHLERAVEIFLGLHLTVVCWWFVVCVTVVVVTEGGETLLAGLSKHSAPPSLLHIYRDIQRHRSVWSSTSISPHLALQPSSEIQRDCERHCNTYGCCALMFTWKPSTSKIRQNADV